MIYLSTPFSRAAANRLHSFDVLAYKIGSGECNNYPLVEHIAGFGRPVILSTGMNDLESIIVALHVGDSQFPTGAFAFSWGLEGVVRSRTNQNIGNPNSKSHPAANRLVARMFSPSTADTHGAVPSPPIMPKHKANASSPPT